MGIFPMGTPHRRSRVTICRGCYGAGIEDYNIGMGRRLGRHETAFRELALNAGAIGLRRPATKVFEEKPRHMEDYNFFVPVLNRQLTTIAGRCRISLTAVGEVPRRIV
jgi:hypothetical protein